MFFIIILFMNTGEILLSFDVKQSINESINQSASTNNTELDMQILLSTLIL